MSVEPVEPRSGRPLDPTRADAIRRATLELLAERGYDRLTVEAVAARAGAGKATVYRRWESKAELVTDAMDDLLRPPEPLPDTGSLRTDLDVLCSLLSDEPGNRDFDVVQGLASALPHDRELMAAFNEHCIEPRRMALDEMLRRAVVRGEMPAGKDVELLTSVIPALIIYRKLVNGDPVDSSFARRIVDEVVIPAATAPLTADRPRPRREGGGALLRHP